MVPDDINNSVNRIETLHSPCLGADACERVSLVTQTDRAYVPFRAYDQLSCILRHFDAIDRTDISRDKNDILRLS